MIFVNCLTDSLLFMRLRLFILSVFLLGCTYSGHSQAPRWFILEDVQVVGCSWSDPNTVLNISGLQIGDSILVPGPQTSEAIKQLWKADLFTDIKLSRVRALSGRITLRIEVKEAPLLHTIKLEGLKRRQEEEYAELVDNQRMKPLNQELLDYLELILKLKLREDGYHRAQVKIDTSAMSSSMYAANIRIETGNRMRIESIELQGTDALTPVQVNRVYQTIAPRKWYALRRPARYDAALKKEGDERLIKVLQSKGYTDAVIVADTLLELDEKHLKLILQVELGGQYYVRSIAYVGNSLYSETTLDSVLNIPPGSIYDPGLLDRRIYFDRKGDLSGLYLNKGYFFTKIEAREVLVDGDSVDLEIQILEGPQAHIGKVWLTGNVRTNDHVLLRELRTRPGDLFDRSAILRSQQALSQLGMIDPNSIQVVPNPHPETGTVDLEYQVQEVIVDRFNVSGSWDQNGTPVGTAALNFNNFSLRNTFRKDGWKPFPSGDGQQLQLSAQSSGEDYYALSFGFSEPWLGGKRPQSLNLQSYYSFRREEEGTLKILGGAASFGKRLQWPDDYTYAQVQVGYQNYQMQDFPLFSFASGEANNLYFNLGVVRNSVDNFIYPRSGSYLKIGFRSSLPYSLWDNFDDYSELSDQERFKWLEFYKVKAQGEWFTPLDKKRKLILHTKAGIGLLGTYQSDKGIIPFERFYLGGAGLNLSDLEARELIGLRGYGDGALSSEAGDPIVTKFTVELRYPLLITQPLSLYALAFAEGGNSYSNISSFDPFNLKRSAGVGLRLYTPSFGMIGFDYGWGFDSIATDPSFSPGTGRPQVTLGFNLGKL